MNNIYDCEVSVNSESGERETNARKTIGNG